MGQGSELEVSVVCSRNGKTMKHSGEVCREPGWERQEVRVVKAPGTRSSRSPQEFACYSECDGRL